MIDLRPCAVPLSQDIHSSYNRLVKIVHPLSPSNRTLKTLEGTRGKVSVANLIAYQIGWGKCLIRWYEAGIRGEHPEMPGDGFSSWDYTAIAHLFYQKYQYDAAEQQMQVFCLVVSRILEIIELENQTGNLDRIGIWSWCTLPSGKKRWPLCKWIRVNTAAPYKRAFSLVNKYYKSNA